MVIWNLALTFSMFFFLMDEVAGCSVGLVVAVEFRFVLCSVVLCNVFCYLLHTCIARSLLIILEVC